MKNSTLSRQNDLVFLSHCVKTKLAKPQEQLNKKYKNVRYFKVQDLPRIIQGKSKFEETYTIVAKKKSTLT